MQATALACSLPQASGVPQSRWSLGDLAARLVQVGAVVSIVASTLGRWLKAERIKPWRFHSWQHVIDPQFLERAKPMLELYENAVALLREKIWIVCSDEKTSMQALERIHPLTPAMAGKPIHVAAHYIRRGVTHLFAALSVADGQVVGLCQPRKRFVDFQTFFLEVLVPEALRRGVSEIRWILDNGSTHAPRRLQTWLDEQRHERGLLFTVQVFWLPKYASWLDQIEIWFSILQRKVLTPGDFQSVEALETRIKDYIDYYDLDAKPIQWTYTTQKLDEKFGTN